MKKQLIVQSQYYSEKIFVDDNEVCFSIISGPCKGLGHRMSKEMFETMVFKKISAR